MADKWRKRLTVAALVVLALSVLGLGGMLVTTWFAPELATWLAQRQLKALGLTTAQAPVIAVTPQAMLVGPVVMGEGEERLTIDRMIIGYQTGRLFQKQLDSIRVYGVEAQVVQTADGWQVHGLKELTGNKSNGSSGGRSLPVGEVLVRGARVTVNGLGRSAVVGLDGSVTMVDEDLVFAGQVEVSGNDCEVEAKVMGLMNAPMLSGTVRLDHVSLDRWRGLLAAEGEEPLLSWANGSVSGEVMFGMDGNGAGEVMGDLALTTAQVRVGAAHPMAITLLEGLPEDLVGKLDHAAVLVDAGTVRFKAVLSGWEVATGNATVTVSEAMVSVRDTEGRELHMVRVEKARQVFALADGAMNHWMVVGSMQSLRVSASHLPVDVSAADLTLREIQLHAGAGPDKGAWRHLEGKHFVGTVSTTRHVAPVQVVATGVVMGDGRLDTSLSHPRGVSLSAESMTLSHPLASATLEQPLVGCRYGAESAVRGVDVQLHGSTMTVSGLGKGRDFALTLSGEVRGTEAWSGYAQVNLGQVDLASAEGEVKLAGSSALVHAQATGDVATVSLEGRVDEGGVQSFEHGARVTLAGLGFELAGRLSAGREPEVRSAFTAERVGVVSKAGETTITSLTGLSEGGLAWTSQQGQVRLVLDHVREDGWGVQGMAPEISLVEQTVAVTCAPFAVGLGVAGGSATVSLSGAARLSEAGAPHMFTATVGVDALARDGVSLEPFEVRLSGGENQYQLSTGGVAVREWSAVSLATAELALTLPPADGDGVPQVMVDLELAGHPAAIARHFPGVTVTTASPKVAVTGVMAVPGLVVDPLAAMRRATGTLTVRTLTPVEGLYAEAGVAAAGQVSGELTAEVTPKSLKVGLKGGLTVPTVRHGGLNAELSGGSVGLVVEEVTAPLLGGYGVLSLKQLQDLSWLRRVATGSGRIKLHADRGQLSTDAQVGRIDLVVPWAWRGNDGFVVSPTSGLLDVGAATVRGVGLKPAAWPIFLKGHELAVTGELATVGGEMSLTHETRLFVPVSGWSAATSYTLSVPDLKEATPLVQTAGGVELSAIELEGGFEAAGTAVWEAGALGGGATLVLQQIGLNQPKLPLRMSEISSKISLETVWPPRTRAHQRVTFGAGSVAGLPFEGGEIDFQLESMTQMFLERTNLRLWDGLMTAHAVQFDPAQANFDLVLYAEHLALSELFKLQDKLDGTITGHLYGKVPLHFRRGRVGYGDGYLFTAPNQPGQLKIHNSKSIVGALGMDDVRMTMFAEALQDFTYDFIQITLEKQGTNEERVRLQVHGKKANAPKAPPIHLNTTLNGRVQSLINAHLDMKKKGIKY